MPDNLVDKSTLRESINKSISLFLNWLENQGYYSNDKDDLLDSKLGLFSKRLFYKNKMLGTPFAAVLLFLETFTPQIIKYLSKPRREAIADAHYALTFLNLYEINKINSYLDKAEELLNHLLETSLKGYSGYCWGYTKGWQTPTGFWPAGTPCITVTPYVYWAFRKHYDLIKDSNSLNVCESIANFVLHDLKKIKMPNGTYSAQYSTRDTNGSVINSTAYRAALLYDAYTQFSRKEFKKDAELNIEFILSYQNKDGSWPYTALNPESAMIDNFHTCFVLKNLYKIYQITKDEKVHLAIIKGYDYYLENLLYDNKRPKHASKAMLIKLRKHEMYDYAEGITLGSQLINVHEKALEQSVFLVKDLIKNFQLKKGYFITRVTSLNTYHKIPYHRWPQAQLVYSLTQVHKVLSK